MEGNKTAVSVPVPGSAPDTGSRGGHQTSPAPLQDSRLPTLSSALTPSCYNMGYGARGFGVQQVRFETPLCRTAAKGTWHVT